MKLFRTEQGIVVEEAGAYYSSGALNWDSLIARDDVQAFLRAEIGGGRMAKAGAPRNPLAPVVGQEIWAAGVTYLRSREARMEESKSAGGGDFYDRVYAAERPELFFKSPGYRAVGTGGKGAHSARFEVERAGAGVDAGDGFDGENHRLHHRQ